MDSIDKEDENANMRRKMHYEGVLGPSKGKLFSPSPASDKQRHNEDIHLSVRGFSPSERATISELTDETIKGKESELRIKSNMVEKD